MACRDCFTYLVSLKYSDVSVVCNASIIRAMMVRLYGAVRQKALMFILAAVRT
jgi:hypothetical protein